MSSDLEKLTRDWLGRIDAAADLPSLEAERVAALGRHGAVTGLLKTLGGMTPQERQSEGPRIHALREAVTEAIAARKAALEEAGLEQRLATEGLDLTLPVEAGAQGSIHPVSQVMDELAEIFADLGFSVATGPEIEDDWHNFTALNIPEWHPARAMHDTFYFNRLDANGHPMLLRTHTSPVQIRAMQSQMPPIYAIAPGRTYRSDSDATHTPMFHQVEGLVIDKGITLGHLKWTLETFLKAFFERDDIVLRLRPSYFPFTEPSAEVDVGFHMEKGRRVLGGADHWMELLGSGMVHPRVIANCGLDPDQWQGFAFGCGIDRLAMLKYGMDDLRAFFDGDLRWLRHYGFAALDVPTLFGRSRRMKFTLSWLKEHLDTDADLSTIVETLTRIGLEVEGVENAAERLEPFVIAEILAAAPHPQADKLQVLSVDAGTGAAIQVVCGDPNARAGMKGVFGAPGAYVPGSDLHLKVATIRGVESWGMMCSARELELGEEHDGIIALAADAPVGVNYASWAGLDDPVINVSVTPNRQDAMGVHGIARDLAAAGLGILKPGDTPVIPGDFPCPIEIRTDDPEGCPAFYGRVIRGVGNCPSPGWLQNRLKAIGQRPISALVDITNHVMLSYGRPLHVYDLARLDGAIVARRARDGEQVLALNGKSYELNSSMTVIADLSEVHDIGGIMGGEHSGVTAATTDIVIECAYFDPERIALTGQKLGLTSDARSRFERGVDPAFLEDGLQLATAMALELAGGAASQIVRAGAPPVPERAVAYDPARCAGLAGLAVPEDRQAAILQRLGFVITRGERWTISVPSWRRDVEGAADIVEEVIRIEGINSVPSTPLPRAPGVAKPTATPEQLVERRARRAAAARGLNEAVTWSFISEREAEAFGGSAWVLANPISEEMKAMRPSLLPGLLAAASRNAARGATGIGLFEVGRRYLEEGERPTLALLLAGPRGDRYWRRGRASGVDAFDAKAETLAILAAAGAPVDNLQVLAGASPAFHPGQSGRLCLGAKAALAEFGALHPQILAAFDLDGPAVAAEIYLDAIPQKRAAAGHMRSAYSPPPLQAVTRDFAFFVPADLPADQLLRAVRGADKSAITGTSLFDLFTGQGVPKGQKSLAIEVVMQPAEKSFTDEELKAISERIVAAAAKLGAVLRA